MTLCPPVATVKKCYGIHLCLHSKLSQWYREQFHSCCHAQSTIRTLPSSLSSHPPVPLCIQGQAVITETLLRAQEGGQNQTDNGESQIHSREYHSSTDSEPFEVIHEEEENITECEQLLVFFLITYLVCYA